MSIPITDKFKPRNNGGFPLMDAEDVLMPDGTRLGDLDLSSGKDGLTPYIGLNGNWWIGEEDTGVQAQGEVGPQGEQGPQGEKGDKGDKGDPGDAASITVDAALDPNSTNPVQNKVICEQLAQAEEVLQHLQNSIPTVDNTLSKAGQAADAGAVGAVLQAAEQTLQQIAESIPTDDHINALIDAKLGVIENGSY